MSCTCSCLLLPSLVAIATHWNTLICFLVLIGPFCPPVYNNPCVSLVACQLLSVMFATLLMFLFLFSVFFVYFVLQIHPHLYLYPLVQWFSNFLHQVPPQKIFGFPSTTILTNMKMQYKWLPTAPGVCSRCVCMCVCVFTAVCVCVHFGWVKCRAQIPSMSRHFHFQ